MSNGSKQLANLLIVHVFQITVLARQDFRHQRCDDPQVLIRVLLENLGNGGLAVLGEVALQRFEECRAELRAGGESTRTSLSGCAGISAGLDAGFRLWRVARMRSCDRLSFSSACCLAA
jgi:hypothetical protein